MQWDELDAASPMSMSQRMRSSGAADTRGKHRIAAEVKLLEKKVRFLEEELEKLEKTKKASAPCKELLSYMETKPDPLLLVTKGPMDPSWNRWFRNPKESTGCKCWKFV